jgi:three-Cys-motif partner protein
MDDINEQIDPAVLDEIGPWSERKHGILQDYAERYSIVLTNAKNHVQRFNHDYIDGFASAGISRRRGTTDIVKGSALRSLDIVPPFDRYTFVELNADRYQILSNHVLHRDDVELVNGDANDVLVREVFPRYTFKSYRRALCLLDPYTHKTLSWDTIVAAGRTKCIDLMLHFPTMPMNRGTLHKAGVFSEEEAAFLTRFWGDESWEQAAYRRDGLFENVAFKVDDDAFVRAFCQHLKDAGGFLDTATPIPKKFQGKTLYYLILAGNHDTAIRKMRETATYFIRRPYAIARKPNPSLLNKSAG